MKERLTGVISSVITPFKNDKIDYEKLGHNMAGLNKTEMSGYLALGGNAETQSLTEDEKLELLNFIGKNSGDKVLLAGVYCESTKLTIKRINLYHEAGAEYIRLAPPHYFPYLVTDKLLEKYYRTIADNSPIPIIMYNSPVLAGGVKISTTLAESLSTHPRIWGIKDSSLTGLYKFINIRRNNPEFHILAGSASFFFPALMAGASGGDMTAANYLPDACCRLYRHVLDGELAEAKELHGRLLSVNSFVSGKWGFCGVKAAMNIMGYEGGEPRDPWSLPDADERRSIEQHLKKEGFLN